MYFSTVLLLFIVSKFTYSADSPSTVQEVTEWVIFDRPLSIDTNTFLHKAMESFRILIKDKISIKMINFINSRRRLDPKEVCETKTDRSLNMRLTQSGKEACHSLCSNKNNDYTSFLNHNISEFSKYVLRSESYDTIILNPNPNSNISNCLLKGESYKCVCSANYTVLISTKFEQFVESTVEKYRTGNFSHLESTEYLVALAFFLKHYPKGSIFYLRWLLNRQDLPFKFKSNESTASDDNELMESSSSSLSPLSSFYDYEMNFAYHASNVSEDSLVPGDIELFGQLYNHIFTSSDDIVRFFEWCNFNEDCFLSFIGSTFGHYFGKYVL